MKVQDYLFSSSFGRRIRGINNIIIHLSLSRKITLALVEASRIPSRRFAEGALKLSSA